MKTNKQYTSKLFLMCGLSFSGKSYLAKQIGDHVGATIISLDGINQERGLDNNNVIPVFEWEETHKIALDRLSKYLDAGKSVIIDDTNPLLKLRDRFRKIANERGLRTIVVLVNTSVETINERVDKVRKNQDRHIAPREALDNLIKMFEYPNPKIEELVIYNDGDNFSEWKKCLN